MARWASTNGQSLRCLIPDRVADRSASGTGFLIDGALDHANEVTLQAVRDIKHPAVLAHGGIEFRVPLDLVSMAGVRLDLLAGER